MEELGVVGGAGGASEELRGRASEELGGEVVRSWGAQRIKPLTLSYEIR